MDVGVAVGTGVAVGGGTRVDVGSTVAVHVGTGTVGVEVGESAGPRHPATRTSSAVQHIKRRYILGSPYRPISILISAS
jgi:hypothetical protein